MEEWRWMTYDISLFFTQVVVIAIEVLGISQLLKNFIVFKKGETKWYSLVALGVTAVCVCMNMVFMPTMITTLFNMVALVTAIVQLGYEAILQGIPNLINSLLSKAGGDVASGTSSKKG